jgi:iron complex outermembrane recepter protein
MINSMRLLKAGLPLGLAALSLLSVAALAEEKDSGANEGIEEIVVTASKLGESTVLKTPISIQAFSADELKETGATDFDDYFHMVPGLSVWDQGPGTKRIILRGINAVGAGTVGLYLDEAVITGENSGNFGGYQPDPKLFDMDRLEVLKGPQGTTFGSSAMSGVIRYITNKPDLDTFSTTARYAITQQDEAGMGSNADVAVNLPLMPGTLAFRIAGYYDREPGWINDRYQEGINNDLTQAGRIEGRLKLNDRATFDVMAMIQNEDSDGKPYYNLTNFQGQPLNSTNYQFGPERTPFPDHLQIYNATFTYNLDSGTITATASHTHRFYDLNVPGSQVLAAALGYGIEGAEENGIRSVLQNPKTRDVNSYEVRYASHFSGPIQTLVGFYESNEHREEGSFVYTINNLGYIDPSVGTLFSPVLLAHDLTTSINETALFGEVNWAATEKLKFIAGLRVFHFDNSSQGDVLSSLGHPGTGLEPVISDDQSSAIGRFNASYNFTDTASTYLQVAQGYRPGGTNDPGAALLGHVVVPGGYNSDRLISYEVGFKQSSFENRLVLTAAAYFINWTDLQVQLDTPITDTQKTSFSYTGNAGGAHVKGAELEAEFAPMKGLRFGLTAGLTDAKITETVPNAGNAGDPIPYTPKTTLSAMGDYRFPLVNNVMGFVGADVSYISGRVTQFPSATLNYFHLDSYALTNMHVGLDFSKWTASLIVKNVFDNRTVIDVFQEEPPITINGFFSNAPRLFMLQMATKF